MTKMIIASYHKIILYIIAEDIETIGYIDCYFELNVNNMIEIFRNSQTAYSKFLEYQILGERSIQKNGFINYSEILFK